MAEVERAHALEARRLRPLARRGRVTRDVTAITAVAGFGLATSIVGFGAATTVVLLGGLTYCALASALFYRRGRRISAYARELIDLLDAGHVDRAEAHARAMAGERNRALRAVGLHDLGYVKLRRGEYDDALALFARVRGTPVDWKLLDLQAIEGMALAHALAGDLDRAELEMHGIRGPDFGVPTTEVVLDCRLGRYREALERELAPRSPLVHRYLDHEIRVIHLMHAFAIARLGGAPEEISAHLDPARPGYAGEYDYLTSEWPELRTFMAANPWAEDAPRVHVALPNAAALPIARTIKR